MGYGKYSCKTLSTLYSLPRKDASSDYRQPMTLQLFLLAISVVLNHQTNPFSSLTKFNRNKVKHKNLNGRSLDLFKQRGNPKGVSPFGKRSCCCRTKIKRQCDFLSDKQHSLPQSTHIPQMTQTRCQRVTEKYKNSVKPHKLVMAKIKIRHKHFTK